MKTMWMAAIGLAALALAGCGGDGSGSSKPSYCETACGNVWECLPDATRPDDRDTYVQGCVIGCEAKKAMECPDFDEAACSACYTATCIPEAACIGCNCLLL